MRVRAHVCAHMSACVCACAHVYVNAFVQMRYTCARVTGTQVGWLQSPSANWHDLLSPDKEPGPERPVPYEGPGHGEACPASK